MENMSGLVREMVEWAAEWVSGFKSVRTFNLEEREIGQIAELDGRYRSLQKRIQKWRGLSLNIYVSFYESLGLGILAVAGAWLIWQGMLTVGELVAFTVYVPQLFICFFEIQDLWVETLKIRPELKRVEEVLHLPAESAD
jgi:ABC-type bacteriocin/lantibiotic exporter with double-glycine peptidase domain